MEEEKKLTGYPSIDKPWLKYYSKEAIEAPLPKMTMYQYIWENNKEYLDDVALRYYGTKVTYGKLFENIKKAASAFYFMGVRKGDIVTIMSMHTPECIYALYGLNYIGAIANMVYMTLSEKEIIDTIENTESKLFLVLDPVLDKIRNIKDKISIPVVVLDVSDSMPLYMKVGYKLKTKAGKHPFLTYSQFLFKGTTEPLMSDDHAAAAVIVYTSGTTGEPKGVTLCNDGINTVVNQLKLTDRLKKRQETALMILPPFIAFGVSMIHRALGSGMDATMWIELDADRIGKVFGKIKPNRFVSGPLLIEGIIRHASGDLSNVYDITGGGEAISPELEDKFNHFMSAHNSKARYMTGYGMSEFSSVITLNWLDAYKKDSIGIPLPLTQIKIIDPDSLLELPYGEEGEIVVSTPCAMQGYYRNERATKEIVDIDNAGVRWFHTGDLGYIDEDGFVFLIGRIKRIYTALDNNEMACKIFPQRIEELLINCIGVKECAVVVKPDKKHRYVPVAFVALEPTNNNDNLDELYTVSKKELPEYMQPEKIIVLDSLPMTPGGKTDYKTLEKMAESL